jgi:dihydrofolate reductase
VGKIVVSENVTPDGVAQDPAGAEGFGRGGWVGRVGERGREEAAEVLPGEALGAEAQLFGRRTDEFLAALKDPDWNNSTVLAGDVVQEVSKLKEELTGEIVVAGSFRLMRTLIEHELVDELRLMIYPVVLGDGERLFGETSDKKPMRLVDTMAIDGDVAYLTYEVVREAA